MNEEKMNRMSEASDLYFKDCFTKVDNQTIDAEFNKVTANCFISKDNKFSLDENGNLTVNSITSKIKITDSIYPVGSIYFSVNSTNPSTIFGGSWISIAQGRTLVGVDSSQYEFNASKKIGGEKTPKLTVSEMPSHSHDIYSQGNDQVTSKGWVPRGINGYDVNQAMNCIKNTGGNQAHNNMPPYFTCYIWQRVA